MVRVLFMGRKQVAANALRWLLERNDADIVGVLTDNHLETSPTNDVARSRNIPVLNFDDTREALAEGTLEYDLGFSMLYWRKISGPYLEVPRLGNINFHPAPLPEYKGTAGYNLAILNSLDTWAVTAHYMDERIDTGRIIGLEEFAVDADRETALSLEAKSQPALFGLFKRVAALALESKERLAAAPNIGGNYTTRRQMEEMKVIQDGDDIDRKIRAFWFPPYDGACVVIDGNRYTLVNRGILETLAHPSTSSLFSPKKEPNE